MNERCVPDRRAATRKIPTVQKKLFSLWLALLVPMLVVQGIIYFDRFSSRKAHEEQSNLEIARAVGQTFERFVQDVLHQEVALGFTLSRMEEFDPSHVTALLRVCSEEFPTIRDFNWVNSQGIVVASSNPAKIGVDVSDRHYFRMVGAGLESSVSDLIHSKTTGEVMFTINRAIRNASGELLGVVVAVVLPDRLGSAIAIERSRGGTIVVFDRSGRCIYHHPERTWSWEDRGALRNNRYIHQALEGFEVNFEVPGLVDQQPMTAAAVPVFELGCIAVASRPRRQAMAPIITGLLRHCAMFLFALLIASLYAMHSCRSLADPLRKLRDYARELGRGRSVNAATVGGPAELRELASCLREMDERIRAREEIIKRDQEHTRQLAKRAQELARERALRLETMGKLVSVSAQVLSAESVQELLKKVADSALEMLGANHALSGYVSGKESFRVGIGSRLEEESPRSGNTTLTFEEGRPYMDLVREMETLRLTREDTHSHPEGWVVPEGPAPLHGLLSTRLTGKDGEAVGLILVSDKEGKADFTEEDEAMLRQLACVASLALHLIESTETAQERNAELEALMKAVPAAVWIAHDPQCRWMSGNPFAYDLLRLPAGTNPSQTAPPGERPESCRFYERGEQVAGNRMPMQVAAAENRPVLGAQLDVVFDDGLKRTIYGNATPLRNCRGDSRGAVAAFMDITDRVKAENALRAAYRDMEQRVSERTMELLAINDFLKKEVEERRQAEAELESQREILQTIIDNIPVMLCYYDPEGTVEWVNPEFETLIGWSAEDANHLDILESCYPDPEYRREAWEYMKGAEPGWRDFKVHVRNGATLESSWANVRLSSGHQIGIGIDIRERKAAEEALRVYSEKLEASNRELQDFAFIASHDLQEPLRKIRTFGSLLLEDHAQGLNEEASDFLKRMNSAATRMQNLIEALLNYSRVTTHAGTFHPVDLREVAREVVSDLEPLIEETGGRVEVGELGVIDADANQMHQLFLNLIGNGLKFHGVESPLVRVYGQVTDREMGPSKAPRNGYYRIVVEDNGIGFDERYLARIFVLFQRLHNSTKAGTGMGLAICRKIVERHGGSITAHSRPGEGSMFVVDVPLAHENAAKPSLEE